MKKYNFAFIGMICWTLIVVLLLCIFIYGLTKSSFASNIMLSKYKGSTLIKEQKFSLNNLSKFNIKTSYESITIKTSDANDIVVYQYGDPKYNEEFQSALKSDNLTINIPHNKNKSMSIFNFSFRKSPRLEIMIPQKYKDDLSLISTSGSISVEGNYDLKEVILNSISGSINIDSLSASSVTFKSTSGSINGESLNVKNNIDLSAISGTIRFQNINSKKYDIKTTSGSFISNKLTGAGNIKSISGSITINNFSILGDCYINTTSGSTNLHMAPSQNCKLTITTTSGSINSRIPINYENNKKNKATGTIGDGLNGTLEISATSGSININ